MNGVTNSFENQNFRLLLSTRKAFVITLALSIVGAAMLFFLTYPEVMRAWESWGSWQEAKAEEQKQKDKLDMLQALETSPDLANQRLVDEALPSRKPLYELLSSVNQVAQQTQVQIDRFELTPGLMATNSAGQTVEMSSTRNGASILRVKYTVAGTFKQLNEYLRRIEEVTPFTTVVKLSINSQINDVQEEEIFTADTESEVYFFSQSLTANNLAVLPKLTDDATEALNALKSYQAVTIPKQTEIIGGQTELFGETINLFEDATSTPAPIFRPAVPATTSSLLN